MSNGFFSHLIKLMAGTKARANDVNDRFDAVELGFEKLPAPHATLKGFSEPVAIAEATLVNHAMSAGAAQKGSASYAADTGAVNFPIVTLPIVPASYSDGLTIRFKAANANTGPVAINVNGLGQKSVVRGDGVELATGDILANQVVTIVYSGTKFYSTEMVGAQLAGNVAAVTALTNTATTQAGIATTQAGEAAASAVTATTQAGNALSSKNAADADAIATAADRLAMANPLLIGTSITSNYIAPSGYKTFVTQAGKSFAAGQEAMAYYNNDPSKWMGGTVISYLGTSLVIDMGTCGGSGTYQNWTLSAMQIAGDVVRATVASDTATTQAGIATAKAAEAAASAVTATTQAGNALSSKNAADADVVLTHADVVTVTAKAAEAAASAVTAESSAFSALSKSNSLLQGSSVTSNYIAPNGQKTFNIGTGKSFFTGMKVTVMRSTSMLTDWMHGTVVSYSGSSIVIAMDSALGSGTYTSWYVVADGLIDPVFFGRPRITSDYVPASATASGVKGDMAWDSDYYYRCTATNTWKRVAMATW